MRSGVAAAVNRQKPKMAENGGPIRPLPACLPPLSIELRKGPLQGHAHTNIETHIHTPDPALPPNEPLIDEVTGREVMSQ